ncbi:hypothetical protein LIG30_3515 [Burkholderia sp. lig30]|jgi:hypothetical protein|uniref:hypothetical protein n=1 Tax=Burkholderia sp. lig30 TaxID=1192124 RepID=UPI000461B6D4|nr:hypothetical protein [Burkholderia sp. lig30]KDB07269.1 hypothetical protein LIG30_3515 [Burkholderia sp. lig30]
MAAVLEFQADVAPIVQARIDAAATANAEDASVWRWFAALLEDRRIRWRFAFDNWVVHVDRKHVATERSFYEAIRSAKRESEGLGVGVL